MQRRDKIVLQKILSVIDMGILRMEDVYQAIVEDFPALKKQLHDILLQTANGDNIQFV